MRKKTHIALAKNIVNNHSFECVSVCRKSFYIGSILPDCVPSFLIEKHNIHDTFYKLKELTQELIFLNPDSNVFWRKLGCVMHYIADYFTLPHNDIFHGNIKEHCCYEKELKNKFREYLNTYENIDCITDKKILSLSDLWKYLKIKHENYIRENTCTVETDISYIYEVCCIVFQTIFQLKIDIMRNLKRKEPLYAII